MKTADLFNITVLILAENEAENIESVIQSTLEVIESLRIKAEILVVDGNSKDETRAKAEKAGARVIMQDKPGFANALKNGFEESKGEYILTIDADLSHHPLFMYKMWAFREEAEIIIGSRYITGGAAVMPFWRGFLSRILNHFYGICLSIPIKDLSSNYRLYKAEVIKKFQFEGRAFDILEEILVKLYIAGYKAKEVPMYYRPRENGVSKARVVTVGIQLTKMIFKLWKIRNSIASADYDEKAYFSRIPFQRYWQRKRHAIITNHAIDIPFVLDVGCGSSVIVRSHPHIVGLDILLPKLLYMRKYNIPLLQGSVERLPFKDKSFDGVICSEVIEHIPKGIDWLKELKRVIKPKGHLILGTPDYGRVWWPMIEWVYRRVAPGGYGGEHASPYTFRELKELLTKEQIEVVSYTYIFGGELIILARLL